MSSIIILSSTVVIMLACAGENNMALLLLAGWPPARLRRTVRGLYTHPAPAPHDHLPWGVALLLEAVA